jgi:hypothetical protein
MFPGTCQEQVEVPFIVRRLERWRQRQIQRLRPSRGKNDIFGRDAGKSGHLGTGSFDYGPRGSPFGMNGGGVAAKVESRAHGRARRGMQGRRGVVVKVNTRARHERNPQPPQIIESREQATRLPLLLAIQKSLQSTVAYVLKAPPGLPGFRGASVGPRPLRPIAARHLKAPRGSQSQASHKRRQCATGMRARRETSNCKTA